jgi:signal transduction histidine kinase
VYLPITVSAAWWNTTLARLVMVTLFLAVLVAVSRVRLQRRYRRMVAELRERQVLNEERSRIAADIHDDLGADLSRLLLYARIAEPRHDGKEGRPLTDGLGNAIDKMDEIIWALDPRRDTLQSTVQFIEQQARESAEAHGLKFRADVRVPRSPVHLTAGHRRELMLLAREAIRNVMDHAKASTLWVEWLAEDDAVRLTVRDDGKGFDAHATDNGRHGLGNMRERAERLGGTLSIGRCGSVGTCVELRFPLAGITRSDDALEERDAELGP